MPKCAFCGKEIKKKYAYVVKKGKRNKYYCNQEHSTLKPPRDVMYEQLMDIFGKVVTNTVLYKEFDELGKIYGYEFILAYIKENYQYLCDVMRKDFQNDYSMIRYLSAIFKNSLGSFEIPKEEVKKEVEVEIYEQKNISYKQHRKGLDELMEDLLDE